MLPLLFYFLLLFLMVPAQASFLDLYPSSIRKGECTVIDCKGYGANKKSSKSEEVYRKPRLGQLDPLQDSSA